MAGTTVRIKLRWPDFTTLTRQVTLPQPTDQDEQIYRTALDLLGRVRAKGQAVRLIGVGVSGLGAPLRQMELWGAQAEKSRRLQETLDKIHDKFGEKSIRRGKALHKITIGIRHLPYRDDVRDFESGDTFSSFRVNTLLSNHHFHLRLSVVNKEYSHASQNRKHFPQYPRQYRCPAISPVNWSAWWSIPG